MIVLIVSAVAVDARAQEISYIYHTRGKLWETIWNYGFYGDPGAWDFLTNHPKGLYPGFTGFQHHVGNELELAGSGKFANANMHTFRGGTWIVAKDVVVPGNAPDFAPRTEPFELFHVGNEAYGLENEDFIPNIVLTKNYVESPEFDPRFPEETSTAVFETNLGLTTTQRTYAWGFPDYDDFIMFDYTFENTGRVVATSVGRVVPNPQDFQQTLTDVYFIFETAVSVSTKSQINLYDDWQCTAAGAFGWKEENYHDFYAVSSDGTLTYSYNYNGGYEPPPNNCGHIEENEQWKRFFGEELMSPAGFGRVALYASPLNLGGAERSSPKPDILRIDSHKGGTFKGKGLDHQTFEHETGDNIPKKRFHDFAKEPTLQEGLGNNGDRFNFFFHIYGPYTIPPGESVRIVFAEIAGMMDPKTAAIGGRHLIEDGTFPDSTMAAIERNARHAQNAVDWGIGANIDGVPVAADVPEPPPAPTTIAANASTGSEIAAIAVTWDDIAERTSFPDASGGAFYDGQADLDGYRIYRSQDFQYNPGNPGSPAFRGNWWDLLAEIPSSEFDSYWDEELGAYKFLDTEVEFGFQYGYYVAGFNSTPRPWTSANGTVVSNLPELESGQYARSRPASAAVGPVASFDIYVAPNPFVFGDPARSFGLSDPYRIEFRNLPERALIRIYTTAGDLVKTIKHGPDEVGSVFGSVPWDQRSESGLLVAPGLYIYYIESPESELVQSKVTGKLMIIR